MVRLPAAAAVLIVQLPTFSSSYQVARLTSSFLSKRRWARFNAERGGNEIRPIETKGGDFSSDCTRRFILSSACAAATGTLLAPSGSLAAPPIAVIAEELGYFPVTNSNGETVYVAKRIGRESSQQAQDLADYLAKKRVVLAGTYWCPHTSRQKELLGRQAFAKVPYVECSAKGYGANPAFCMAKGIDGYPTWVFPDGKRIAGERGLAAIAEEAGFRGFDENLETNLPPPIGASACSIRK